MSRWLNSKRTSRHLWFHTAVIILFKQLEHKLYIYPVNFESRRSSAARDGFFPGLLSSGLVDFDAFFETTQNRIFAQSRLLRAINHGMASAKTSAWTHSHRFQSQGKESFFLKILFNIFNFQRQVGSVAPEMTAFFLTGQLFCDAFNCILLSTSEKPRSIFFSFLWRHQRRMMTALVLWTSRPNMWQQRRKHLKLHKRGIYSPTTKRITQRRHE